MGLAPRDGVRYRAGNAGFFELWSDGHSDEISGVDRDITIRQRPESGQITTAEMDFSDLDMPPGEPFQGQGRARLETFEYVVRVEQVYRGPAQALSEAMRGRLHDRKAQDVQDTRLHEADVDRPGLSDRCVLGPGGEQRAFHHRIEIDVRQEVE